MARKKMSVRKRPQYDDEFKAEAVRLMQLAASRLLTSRQKWA